MLNLTEGKFNYWDILWLLLPIIMGFSTSLICPITKEAGKNVKFRPPSWVFSVVWSFLFISYGFSWSIAIHNSSGYKIPLTIVLYSLTLLSLIMWIIIYGCIKNKKVASWILIVSLSLSFMSFTQGNDISKILLSPLIAWCIFAILMSTTEIQEE
ncbi:MAG: hypothetical protein CBD97_02090 [Pelagibacteraceae bacterium TMED237]|nr:MAG: hypothetical protein CBD97_02090 [Pelagibacteraceae bacterium TMED237]|tara:strand:- start:6942 stop:7406 length:465 start_codon:yes stop_codon:yes gene_type:complete